MSRSYSAEPNRRSPYSSDIKWRVVWQRLSMGLTFTTIAKNLNIAVSTAHRIYSLFEQTGSVEVERSTSRPQVRKLDDYMELFVIGIVLEHPTIYLRDLCQKVEDISSVRVSEATICKLIKRHGITRKKVQKIALQRSSQLRGEFMATALLHNKEQFVFVDETGCDNRSYMRKYGYAVRGCAPQCHHYLIRGERVSAVAAISTEGLVAADYKTGSVNADFFFDFIRGSLIPHMNTFNGSNPRSIVVLDNCSIHHVQGVTDLFRAAGILVMFLPPYSPDYNPIEQTFSYVKYYIKQHDDLAQQLNDKTPILQAAFSSVTSDLTTAWIASSGYS